MERSTGLAEIKLVSKYYPVNNYSYPRADAARCQRKSIVGRGSLDSDCSMPGMVDDHGSDVSAEDDYQYHVSAAELWDSFWQASGTSEQRSKRDAYPGFTAPPALRPQLSQPEPRIREETDTNSSAYTGRTTPESPPSWPLPCNSAQDRSVKTITPKASYSLFPAPARVPTIPVLPPRLSSLGMPPPSSRPHTPTRRRPAVRASSHSLSAVPKMRPNPIDLGHAASHPSSAPVSPMLALTSPPIGPPPSELPPPPRRPALRNRSASAAAGSYRPQHFIPPSFVTATSAPPTITTFSGAAASSTSSLASSRSPTPAQMIPLPPISPPKVSVFEADSDTEEDDSNDKSFARRIVKGLAHKRSFSDTRRTAKGDEFAKEQLRRARSGTMGETSEMEKRARDQLRHQQHHFLQLHEQQAKPKLKRHGSDVFAKLIGRKSH
ncbi:uncharacterized protein E0L32_008305 [Thyridium curvatum]|uniref:Uncharacterized protein n=1 Tax=Thyridium curvatum TaxID=1093900 RepID=A0A507AVJ8_9PEZI|nr:uncharacterized protein E0L32_008305 [Thyridium curvatum]TPX10736.1 hypothetical protein E0L32_008305 [Thyridium curvatum]